MAAFTVQTSARSTKNITFTEAGTTGPHTFANTGKEKLMIKNDSASSVNVTVVTTQTVDGEAVADKVIAVAAGAISYLGPWPVSIYSDADGDVTFSLASATDVDVAVVR